MGKYFIFIALFLGLFASDSTPEKAPRSLVGYRGLVAHTELVPLPEGFESDNKDTFRKQHAIKLSFWDDGLLLVRDGKVKEVGGYKTLIQKLPKNTKIIDYSGYWILPGFIDSHIHYPQMEMVGAYGAQLLDWLNIYTFPTEKKYSNYKYSLKRSNEFLDELLRNGTTSALVFATVHPESVDAFFDAALSRNMRMISGKVLMDRNAPDYLLDTPELAYTQSKSLIGKWHNKGRLQYAVTPRFAPTSTDAQLQVASRLLREHPTVYLHTHLSENPKEIEWVKELFPNNTGYFDVYDKHKLTGSRSIFAHAVHLTEEEILRIRETDSKIAFCPTSNLFLGSGLFPYHTLESQGITIGMGTDIGAGTSFSMIRTMGEAYKVLQLQGKSLSSIDSFYLSTLGSARALGIDSYVGNFQKGKEADFVVIDPGASPLMKLRMEQSNPISDQLFALFALGDDRNVRATYIMGKKLYDRK
jgi:guanine deaminase